MAQAPVSLTVRKLIPRMHAANPLWGAPRIHGELLKLGFTVSQSTVAKYLGRRDDPPSQTWRTFLTNHVSQLASIDFFTVPPLRFACCLSSWCCPTTDVASST